MPTHARTISIIDHATGNPVTAILRDGLRSHDLAAVEESWRAARNELIARQVQAGRQDVTEHGHWDWSNKYEPGALDEERTIAVSVTYDGECQGLMTVIAAPRPSRSRVPLLGRFFEGQSFMSITSNLPHGTIRN